MAITKRNPNTVLLGGGDGPGADDSYTRENTLVAGVAVTPAMLVEIYSDSGVAKIRPHASASGLATPMVAEEQIYVAGGVNPMTKPYAIGDLVSALILHKGTKVWGMVPSGENIAVADLLESNGDGYLKKGTTAPVFRALESTGGAVTKVTYVRMEAL